MAYLDKREKENISLKIRLKRISTFYNTKKEDFSLS